MATCTWDGGTDNWNDAANWNTDGATDRVPITGDDVVINTDGATVTLDDHIGGGQTNTGLGSLTITAGTLQTNDGSNRMLKVTGVTSITGILNCTGSDIFLGDDVDDAYSVVVNSGGTFTGGTGTHKLGAISVNSGATNFTFSSGNTTITGRATSGNSRRVLSTSATDRITAAGTLIIDQARTPLSIRCDDTTGINNLTMNCGTGRVLHIDNTLTLVNTLNVSAGTVTTRNVGDTVDNNLTVGGHITGNGTLTAGASTVSVTGVTSVATVNITTGTYNYFDDFRPTTCNITDNATFNQTSIGGQFGGRIIITASKTPTFNAIGRLHSSLDIQSGEQGNSTFNLDLSEPQTGPSRALFFHNLELDSQNTENNTFTMAGAITCTGNLTITDGIIDTSGSNHALTVTGDVSITGTLTGNASAITIGKMLEITNGGTYNETSGTTLISGQPDGDYVLRNHDGGTYTKHATGILKIARTSSSGTKYAKFGEDVYNDVKLENTSSGSVVAIVGVMNLAGDLTVVEGELRSYGGTGAIDVDSNVSIEDGGKFSTETSQLAAGGVNADFGSLIIKSGGEYDATPLTTTIHDETGGKAYQNEGTFTHNNGTVLLHADIGDTEVYAGSSSLYNLTSSTGNNVWLKENIIIDNDLTVTSGTFGSGGGNNKTVTVYGNAFISGGQLGNGSETGAYTVKGLVTLTGGTFDLSSGTINLGGIRNAGGTIA